MRYDDIPIGGLAAKAKMEANIASAKRIVLRCRALPDPPTEPFQVDAKDHWLVVLGLALNQDGSMTENLIKRIHCALDMWKMNPHCRIIVSGGEPIQGNTQASLMKKWLNEAGVPDELVIPEANSVNTLQNAQFSLEILSSHQANSFTIITAPSHIKRAIGLFQCIMEQRQLKMECSALSSHEVNSAERLLIEPKLLIRFVASAWGVSPAMLNDACK